MESKTPVNAPNGESNNESPRLASVNPNLSLMPGIEATQVPNTRLDDENKNPTANAGLSFINEEIFLIIISNELLAWASGLLNRITERRSVPPWRGQTMIDSVLNSNII